MPAQLNFLKSVRFWKLVAAGIVLALNAGGVISTEVSIFLLTPIFGSAAIRTIDRFAEVRSGR